MVGLRGDPAWPHPIAPFGESHDGDEVAVAAVEAEAVRHVSTSIRCHRP